MHATMLHIILYFICTSIFGHVLYFILERMLKYPLLTPLRQLGFEDLIREDFISTPAGLRSTFTINFSSVLMLSLHVSAYVTFPWYVLAFTLGSMLSTWRMTYTMFVYGLARDKVLKFHVWLDSFKAYFIVLKLGVCTMSMINRLNPFKRWSIRISRTSAETYGLVTIFGLATAIYYVVRKFYVKDSKNRIVPHSGKQSRNQAAINLGVMVLSFVAFSDFSLWKQFSDWLRFQTFASSVFGNSSEESCKNFTDKNKKKGCSATELGPSLCQGCCASQAQLLAASHTPVAKFDIDSIMADPRLYFPILAKQIIQNPKEIPSWFLSLPRYIQQAVFDGYYANRSIKETTGQLSLDSFLEKKFFAKYSPISNTWTLSPRLIDEVKIGSSSDYDTVSDDEKNEPQPHNGPEPSNPIGVEIDMSEPPRIDLEQEFPLLKRIPKILVTRIGFLVAMSLLTYGIYLYNTRDEPSEEKYVPPGRRHREEEHKKSSELYSRSTPESALAEHRGKVTYRQQQSKQTKQTRDDTSHRRGYIETSTSDVENTPEQWYKRFKQALSKYYMLYDSNDLQSILKDGGITFFGADGDMKVAKTMLEFDNLSSRGYYCDPTLMRPISKGKVIFMPDANKVDIDMSILQDMARGKPVRANAMQKLAGHLQDEDIILDAAAQSVVDNYHRINDTWFGPRNPLTQTPNAPNSRKESPESAEIIPTATRNKPPVILKRPPGLDKKLFEMTGKTLDRTCCTDERLCEKCVTTLIHRKAALCTSTPPVLTDLMDAALNDFGESTGLPEKGKIADPEQKESSTALADQNKVCPFDGRSPGCRQDGCQLEHPAREPQAEALNGYHSVSHFPDKLTTDFVAIINLKNPNDNSISKQGTCYITHSHLSTAGHVFETRDGKKIPIEFFSIQFPGSETQFAIAPNSVEQIPFSETLQSRYAGEQVRFKLVENMILSTKTTAPIGIPSDQQNETIYILTVRGKDNSPWAIESKVEDFKDGMLYFSSNTQGGDSGAAVVSARTGNVIATYWGRSADPKLNMAIANDSAQLPYYASGQKLKQNFSHPSLRVTSQWRGTF